MSFCPTLACTTPIDHGCHLANRFRVDPDNYEVILIIAGLVSYRQFGITIKIKPTAWREFLGGRDSSRCEALS
jgi:hypothetical protein